jgi:hypothetical protein
LETKELAVAPCENTIFHQGIFYQKQHVSHLLPPASPELVHCDSYLFPQLKINPKDHHFNTLEVIEAESHNALNPLTEHAFQTDFKMAEALGTVHTSRRELLRG